MILKICGIALIGLICVSVMKTLKNEISGFISAATGLLIVGSSFALMYPVISYIGEISNDTGFSLYIETILKAIGIAMISQTTSDICRDCGENAIAGRVEFAEKASIMLISLPVVKSLIALAFEVMEK